MKKIKNAIVTALIIGAFLFGRFGDVDLINMRQVVDIQSNENGLLITLEDGNGYYWER